MTKRFLAILIVSALVWASWSAAFTVTQAESVIVARFGDPRRTVTEPGLHFKLPAPLDTLWRVDHKIRLLDVSAEEYLTADKKNLFVGASIAWSVADPLRFLQSAAGIEQVQVRLVDLVHTQIGNVLGRHTFADLISTDPNASAFEDIDTAIGERAATAAEATYGVAIHATRITRLTFPAQNKRAVFGRMEAERQKIAQEIRSQGTEEAERIRSDAELEASKLISEAQREAENLRGAGAAEAARIYNEAYARDPELYELLRTLEAMEKTFGPDDTWVLPTDHPLLRLLTAPESTGLLGEGVTRGGEHK